MLINVPLFPASENSIPSTTTNRQKTISDSLRQTAQIENAKCLIVGYSPTGGGHTGRTLNIVKMALEKNKLPHGSSVIFHVPPAWPDTNKGKSAFGKPLSDLCRLLSANKVNVILAQSDKPIYGYLTKSGGSDDTNIMRRLASYPQREVSNKTLADAKLFHPNNSDVSYQSLPTITAKNIFSYIVGEKSKGLIAEEKIYVLTDMAPDLQKAAGKHNIMSTHRVDQQNHAIMLQPNDQHDHNPKNALLTKVLGGTGEQISHIGLGEKNTLQDVAKSLAKLKITQQNSLDEARQAVYKVALNHAQTPIEITSPIEFTGVITADKSVNHTQIKRMTYVYAHKKNDIIIQYIIDGINHGKPGFKDHLFMICGANALPKYNALHLSYIADADGITTAGAGTTGESVYLHNTGSSTSNLLVLPIEEHNEQEANALYLQKHSIMAKYMTSGLNKNLSNTLDNFFKRPLATSARDMRSLFSAVQNEETYVKQACDTLFGDASPSEQSRKFALREQGMRRNHHLTVHRRFFKLVGQLDDNIGREVPQGIKLTTSHQAISQQEALDKLMDTTSLALFLETDQNTAQSLPMLEKIRAIFQKNINAEERAKVTEKLYQSPYTGF
ncbi:hypothetical protein F0225_12990 [Vibrio pectenicida]|uniref:Uncharacterized protein n=1 Tax=Vibrio pectenicida TaxID=62763 RepID=A0A7Y4EFB1_9VIBR|nr:hypothetical protein [Vibrio pectenicida]NOH72246.1 hypothetical protein [Vibrio pectenicida]